MRARERAATTTARMTLMRDIIRRVRLSPYRKGQGPRYSLTMWDTHKRDWRGQTYIGYELRMYGDSSFAGVLFEGEDFAGSPCHADDSDATVRALLSFLTLRPGDTDESYFAGYTPHQLAWADTYAEALAMEASARFGDDDGGVD